MLSLYRKLLVLYPAEHRAEFGEEMVSVFLDVRRDRKGVVEQLTFCAREIMGLVSGAVRERLRLIGARNGLSLYSRRLDMRNGFRFPKMTIVFMALILGGVLVAIKKGQDIASSVPNVNPPLPVHIQPTHSILLGGMPLFFAFFYAAGLIGWAILFALKRSGVHRMDQIAGEK